MDQADLYLSKQTLLTKSSPSQDSTRFDIDSISMHSTPQPAEVNVSQYTKQFKLNLLNENGDSCGQFGWCFICRRRADFYCRDTRKPICSKKCKSDLLSLYGSCRSNQIRLKRCQLDCLMIDKECSSFRTETNKITFKLCLSNLNPE